MSEPVVRLNAALEGRYRIEHELGEGGMATVYLATDLKHNRRVALKVLKPELAAVVGAERFLAEIETTANLQHPHILPLFDSGEADGFLFYVMPYVEGESLADRLARERQLPVDEAVRIGRDLAEALDYAHRQGVIHRDIKPANILMNEGRPLIADFGIALAVGSAGGARLTETGLSVGTPYYMSPEQATGDQSIRPASDTYALACVVFEMLVGEPPYPGATAQAVLGRIIAGGPVSATEQRPTVPANVDAAIRRALEKLPADRFASTSDFGRALGDESFRHGAAVKAGALAGAGSKNLTTALAASTVLFAAALAWTVLRPAEVPQVARYSVSLPDGHVVSANYGANLTISPDGSRWVYVAPNEAGATVIWVRRRDQLDPVEIPGTEGARSPSFSPDGERIVFQTSTPRTLKTVSLQGEPPITVLDDGIGVTGSSWGADGYLYYTDMAQNIRRVRAAGGEPETVSTLNQDNGETRHVFPQALPGGRGVLFTIWKGTGARETMEIAVVDLATGRHEVLVPGMFARYATSGHLVYVSSGDALLAVPFDVDRLELDGAPAALAERFNPQSLSAFDLAVSEEGTLLYHPDQGSGEDQLVWVDRDGTREVVDETWSGTFESPSLSGDGSRVAVGVEGSAGSEVWIKTLDRGPSQRLTVGEGSEARPVWSPDDRTVMYYSSNREGASVPTSLWSRQADGSGVPTQLFEFERDIVEAEWSPDGEWLVFRTSAFGLSEIYAIRPGTDQDATPLVLAEDTGLFGLALSPDGAWLAYNSAESGRDEVYVVPFPDATSGKRIVSTGGGFGAVWAHSGRELFYVSPEGNMMAVDVTTDPTFTPTGQPRVLFPAQGYLTNNLTAHYDISGDDQRFMMIQRTGGSAESAKVIVVENFFEVLRARFEN
ncbi:MAG: protein kinase [Gemmatimonadales bacterium]|nr:MAG: protein kinase [Gemmatimonadales bacterium]